MSNLLLSPAAAPERLARNLRVLQRFLTFLLERTAHIHYLILCVETPGTRHYERLACALARMLSACTILAAYLRNPRPRYARASAQRIARIGQDDPVSILSAKMPMAPPPSVAALDYLKAARRIAAKTKDMIRRDRILRFGTADPILRPNTDADRDGISSGSGTNNATPATNDTPQTDREPNGPQLRTIPPP